MYFVYSGVLDVEVNGKIVTQLKEGAFFGEVALLGQVPRTASITARRNTCLYSLDRETLEDILIDYEDVSLNMQKIYEERAKRAKIEQESRSDEQKRAMSLRVMQPKRISTDRRESIQPSNRQASRRPTMTQSKSSINAEPVNFFAKRASTISGKI